MSNGNQVNDIGSTVSGYASLFDIKYIKFFVKGILSKTFYILSASFGLIGFGIIGALKYIVKEKSEKNNEKEMIVLGLLIFFVSFCVCLISTLIPMRMDVMFYGRYYEPDIGMLLIIGLFSLLTWGNKLKCGYLEAWFISILYKLSYISTDAYFRESLSGFEGPLTFPCITGIARYFYMNIGYENVVSEIFSVTLQRMIIIFGLFIILNFVFKRNKIIVSLFLTVSLTVIQFSDACDVVDSMKYYENERYSYVDPIAKEIDAKWKEAENIAIYYYHDAAQNNVQANILALQLKVGKTPIRIVNELTIQENVDFLQYIILNKTEVDYEGKKKCIDEQNAEYLCETALFELYVIQ